MKQDTVYVRHSSAGLNPVSSRMSRIPSDEIDPGVFELSGPGNSETTENGVHMFHI